MRRHVLRFFGVLLVLAVAVAAIVTIGARVMVGRSLPVIDGPLPLTGLAAPVTVTRDALGVPTVTAQSRVDLARAVGFVHAQERFFQMDLQRRQPAGELSALVGAAALPSDRALRVHRFRHIAGLAVAKAPADYRAELEAYTAGVNAGLTALAAPPFEYLLLRTTPEPWRVEDSMLTAIAMYVTLQGAQWEYEKTLGALHDAVPEPLFEFLAGRASDWESPIAGPPQPVPPVPAAEVFGLKRGASKHVARTWAVPSLGSLPWWAQLPREDEAALGSNSWAVSGARSKTGSAMVANDMHLRLGAPNIWYRATFVIPDDRRPGATRTLSGVTLPGGPQMAVGSNGDIAWGFTNSVGDWSDVVLIDPVPGDATKYQSSDGPRGFERHDETIVVKGAAPVTLPVRWTIWGPVVGVNHDRRELALKWVAHDPQVLATDPARVAQARSVVEAMHLAVGAALAAENMVVGDRDGHIGWTIYGAVPRRVGFRGDVPTSWADGTHRWDGYLGYDEHPRVVDPLDGRVWSANARVVGGAMLDKIGDGGYSDGIRAWMIHDDLMKIDQADERALFAIQLDNRSVFLDRWRTVFLAALTPDAARGNALRSEARGLVDTAWSGRSDADSVAYRLVRTFRLNASRMATDAIVAGIHGPGEIDFGTVRRIEGPLWRLVHEQPAHLLDPDYPTWDAFLLAAIDQTIATMTAGGQPLGARTWGEQNTADIAHPLTAAVPFLGRWLSMPHDPLSGDVYAPRVLTARSGASERLVVSPGHEATGILHMPGGQSGHPLSPHYRDQQSAWVTGTPLPLEAGPGVHTLTLTPR
ncbi:MAG: penicillin acylase family protein [Acidobacteriota bacterium]